MTQIIFSILPSLPLTPLPVVQTNFVSYFALDFTKPGHDPFIYRHANGLCVIGLMASHVAFKDEGGITAVDFNVGKSDRSGIKVTGKCKKEMDLVDDILLEDVVVEVDSLPKAQGTKVDSLLKAQGMKDS